jgi:hypothetical protein
LLKNIFPKMFKSPSPLAPQIRLVFFNNLPSVRLLPDAEAAEDAVKHLIRG